MTKTFRIVLALCAFFVLAFTVAACGGDEDGNDVPSNAVASVDGTAISKADYDRWVEINAKSNSAAGGTAVVPDPPRYERCIAALEEQARAARSRARLSETQLLSQCRQLEDTTRRATMAFLITAAWLEDEAERQDIEISDADVRRLLADARRSFPRPADYDRFLRQSGMTEEDVILRLRLQELQRRITEKVQRSAGNVTEAQIEDYYNRNREQFAVPERRDLELILTRTEAQADEAKRAVEDGTSWADAARRWSTDPLSRGNGGRLAGVARGQQDRALDTAAFNAREGVIVGPVRGQFGWYVVRVTRVTPAKQNSLDESRAQIRDVLRQQGSSRVLETYFRDLQERLTEETNCREGYVIEYCANAPRARTTSTAGGTVAAPEQR